MLPIIVFMIFGLVAASGTQPCYNAADPDNGVGNYCACDDGKSIILPKFLPFFDHQFLARDVLES